MKNAAIIDYLQIRPNMLNGVLQFRKPQVAGSNPVVGSYESPRECGGFWFLIKSRFLIIFESWAQIGHTF
jgi:hypothetical protein